MNAQMLSDAQITTDVSAIILDEQTTSKEPVVSDVTMTSHVQETLSTSAHPFALSTLPMSVFILLSANTVETNNLNNVLNSGSRYTDSYCGSRYLWSITGFSVSGSYKNSANCGQKRSN